MPNKVEKILAFASSFEKEAIDSLVAEAKKKEKKKLDPKAKVRNRGTVCVPAEQAKDKKDHFPINDADQARNALARVHQYSSVPEWYKGSLSGLQALVARKVKAKYPKIDVGGKKEKKSSLEAELFSFAQDIQKYGQTSGQVRPEDVESSKNLTQGMIQSISAVNIAQLTPEKVNEYVDNYMEQVNGYFHGNQIDGSQYAQISQAAIAKKQQAQQAQQAKQTITIPTQEIVTKKTPVKSKWPSIDPIFQTMLGTSPDTALGPQTQTALEMYKKSVGIPNAADEEGVYKKDSKQTNQQAFESLKQRPEYKTKTRMEWDDNSNTYKQPAGGIVRESPF